MTRSPPPAIRPDAMPDDPFADADTLAFYDREAKTYAARARGEGSPHLKAFMAGLAPGARVLELGCGGGQDAEVLLGAGFDVVPTDGSAGLAAVAEARLGRPVRVMRFEELADVAAYDGVWANACLLHVPEQGLSAILARIRAALRPGGLFSASYKSGTGGGRDSLGRYYNFPTRTALVGAYEAAGPWSSIEVEEAQGGGYDKVERLWLIVSARAG